MIVSALLLIVFALAAILIFREPEIRRRIAAVLRRREGIARAALGVSQPRDLQRQALSLVKEGALVSIGAVYLPSEIAVILNPSDLEHLGDLRSTVTAELTEAIVALDRQPAGQGLLFLLQAKPNVTLGKDAALPRGEVDVRLSFLEGTVALTVNRPSAADCDQGQPKRRQPVAARLQVEIEAAQPFSALLHDGLVVGRSASCTLCIAHDSISRRHAKFTISRDGIAVIDLNSTNGVRIGDSADPIPAREPIPVSGQTVLRLSDHVVLTVVDD